MRRIYTFLFNYLESVVDEAITEYQKIKSEIHEAQPLTEDANVR